jgi:hypothetical protein
MSYFRGQTKNTSDGSSVIPIVVNNNNFNKGLLRIVYIHILCESDIYIYTIEF